MPKIERRYNNRDSQKPDLKLCDRREKLVNYQTIGSLQEYVLVSQDEIKVEVYRQDLPGNWTQKILGIEDKLVLNSVKLSWLAINIYEDRTYALT